MRTGALRVFQTITVTVFALLATRPAAAIEFSLQIFADGDPIGVADQTRLGCVDNADGVSAECNATELVYGHPGSYNDVSIDIIGLHIDSDPVVTGTVGVTNLQLNTQQFTFVFTLPVTSMPLGTVTGGSFRGSVTDANGDGVATVATGTGSALYYAQLDGANWQPLYPAVASFTTSSSANIPQTAFGQPIPSLAGPAVFTSIGIKLDFSLTGNDIASFTSNHVVQPVPEPGTAALVGLGLAFLARRRRSESSRFF